MNRTDPARPPRLARAALFAALLSGAATAALAQEAVATAPRADVPADPREARLQELEAEVQALAAQLADLKAQSVAEVRDLRDGQARQPRAVIANGKPGIASADGRFTANLHAVTQLDGASYFQASPGPMAADLRRSGPALGASASNADLAHARKLKGGDLFRRARLGVDGTAFGDWDYRILLDFGGTGVENAGQVYETWVQYSGLKPLRFRVGAFSPSLGLDDQASTSSMPFLERAAVTDVARGLAAGDTRTAFQVSAGGDRWLAAAAITGRTIGALNSGASVTFASAGTASAPVSAAVGTAQTYGDQLGYTARLAGTPLRGGDYLVHLGINASYLDAPATTAGPSAGGATPLGARTVSFSTTPEVRVDSTRLINTGAIPARSADTEGLEFAVQRRNLLLQAEYQKLRVVRSDGLSSPSFSGWYVSGGWVLTGERRAYNPQSGAFDAVPVAHPFSLKTGGLGAWEIGARYSELNLDHHAGQAGSAPAADAIRGGEERNLSFALNWYPNPVVRFMVDYAHVDVRRLSPSAAAYQTPTGAQIGQHFDVLSGRAQFAF